MPEIKKQTPKPVPRKSGGVLDRIAPVELSERGIKLSVYGKSGTGKTVLACTAPKPLLLVGTEDGTKSVHNVKGVEFVRIKSSGELTEISKFLREGSKYATVALDTASGLQDLIMKEILGLDEMPAQRSWAMAKQQEWGQCALEAKERLRSLLDLTDHVSLNVIIISQERNFNEESQSDLILPTVGSALSPSVTGWLNAASDYICQTYLRRKKVEKTQTVNGKAVKMSTNTEEVEYCLRTAPHDVFTVKFRVPKGSTLPQSIIDPDFSKIEKVIRGEWKD